MSAPQPAPGPSPDPSSKTVIGFINVAHLIDHYALLILPTAVLGMVAEFDMSYGDMLALATGGFVAFGAGSMPAGWLGDRWSRRNMIAVFFFGIGLSLLAVSVSQGPMALAVCLTAVGLFGAIYHPVGGAMLAAHATKLGSTLGINGVFGNVGVAIAALSTGALVTLAGWRVAFAAPGVLSIVIGFIFLAKVSRAADRPAAAKKPGPPLPRSLMVRAFIVMAIVMTAGSMIFNATTVALPKLFDERITLFAETPMGIGMIVSGVYLCGAVAQVIIGHWLDRHTLKTAFLPIAALLAPCLALSIVTTDWAMIVVGMLLMFAVFGQVTINDAMVARYSSDAWRARAYAVRYFLSFGIAAAVVPMLSALHNRTGDFSASFTILAVGGCIVLFGALIFPTRPDELGPAKPTPSLAPTEARA